MISYKSQGQWQEAWPQFPTSYGTWQEGGGKNVSISVCNYVCVYIWGKGHVLGTTQVILGIVDYVQFSLPMALFKLILRFVNLVDMFRLPNICSPFVW